LRHVIGPGRRRRLAVGLTVVAFGLLGAAVALSRPTQAPDAQAPRAVAASKPAAVANPAVIAKPAVVAKPAVIAKPAAIAASKRKPAPSARQLIRKQMPNPVRISIPAIGVNARVTRLGLNPDRTVEVPKNLADTGWFELGPEPGERGSAVILGHLESLAGAGVFKRLRELRVGKVITIHLQDGSKVQYVADSMIRVPKSRFPTDRVYAQTKQPTLRLITCAGTMNPATGYHPDNYIVFASLVR
jgi:LPXTG-site transpeptidase (sortase) family protein